MTAATRNEIVDWLLEGRRRGATHVIIMVDTFDYEDYPVYIMPGTNPRDHKSGEMQRIMECYALHLPLEEQLAERRSHHWEMPIEQTQKGEEPWNT